jgi:Family of unknown function (DUF6518)
VAGSRKLIALLVAAVVFGVLMAVVKGQDTGVRDALGNTSAPWVLLPFLAGTRYTRIWHAALIGLATTLSAFFGFYLAEAAILDLGAHPWYTDLQLTLGSGRLYEKWGLASGLVYGALGGIWTSSTTAGCGSEKCSSALPESPPCWRFPLREPGRPSYVRSS